MSILQSILLGIIQGITEFIPISSSGHLVLAEKFMQIRLEESTLKAFDVILHGGTLLALFIYFYKEWISMIKAVFNVAIGKKNDEEGQAAVRFFLILVVATVPAALVGLFFEDLIDTHFRTPLVIATMMVLTAIYFYVSEKYPKEKEKKQVSFWSAIYIGIAQSFALLPGISRSGITMATGLMCGVNRIKSARFAFMLGVPIILGANIIVGLKLLKGGVALPPVSISLIGFFTSAIFGIISIKVLFDFFRKYTLKPFSVYLIIMAFVVYGVLVNGNLEFVKDLFVSFFIPFFRNWGYPVVLLSAFVEAIPLLGVIIPGGTLIILSGVFAAETGLNLFFLILFSSVGAIIGDFVGYMIGRKYGEEFLVKYGPRIGFKEEYLYVTHRFCHQYGGFALIIGRFNNIVRPFVPMVVGSSKMKMHKFWFFNILGGVLWSVFSVLVGYFARQSWEVVQKYVGIGGGILFTSMIIGAIFVIHLEVQKLREKRKKKKEAEALEKFNKEKEEEAKEEAQKKRKGK